MKKIWMLLLLCFPLLLTAQDFSRYLKPASEITIVNEKVTALEGTGSIRLFQVSTDTLFLYQCKANQIGIDTNKVMIQYMDTKSAIKSTKGYSLDLYKANQQGAAEVFNRLIFTNDWRFLPHVFAIQRYEWDD